MNTWLIGIISSLKRIVGNSGVVAIRNDDLTFEGDFDPTTGELWATSGGSNPVLGYRYNPVSMTDTGTISLSNPDTTLPTGYSIFGVPSFTFDSSRNVFWAKGASNLLLKIDAATSAILHAISPSITGNTSTGQIVISNTNDVWLLIQDPTANKNTYFYKIDPNTLQPTSTYTLTGRQYGLAKLGFDGNILFIAPNGNPTNPNYIKDLLKFDVTTGSTSTVFSFDPGISDFILDTTRNTIWLKSNSGTLGYYELNPTTWTLTGQSIATTLSLVHDSIHDLFWGINYGTDSIVAYKPNGTQYGVLDSTVDPNISNITENALWPGTGHTDAVYFMTQPYDDATSTQMYYLVKVPYTSLKLI
ncbi:hypothetical protein RsoM2USA_59 [Ralstonia phage RsoM2USA]|nr:hypothetical protein RsoM2USA_59 [Ralstonia phage RsoM2USA]